MKGEFGFEVAGSAYQNRQTLAIVAQHFKKGDPIKLVREPENRFDPNAVQVWVERNNYFAMLGYVPRDIAARLAPLLDQGKEFHVALDAVLVDPSEEFDPIRFRVWCSQGQIDAT